MFKISSSVKALFKRHFLFLILVPFIISTQLALLSPHLEYGFSDVDWGFLSFYREYKTKYPGLLNNLINTFKHWGVYAHQSYYIGLQGDIFGLDFRSFQLTTHLFKTFATLATYPLFFVLSGSALVAFASVVLFAFSYPAVGTMYTVVTSSDYSAVLSLAIFAWLYWYIVTNKKSNWRWLLLATFLLVLTLFFSTERMYPIPFFVLIIEAFLLWQKGTVEWLKDAVKRLGFLFLPLLLAFSTKPILFLDFIFRNGGELASRIGGGDWMVMLTPFISLGSLVVPHNYWKYFGIVNMENLSAYLNFLINGPLLIFAFFTVAAGLVLFSGPWKFILRTLLLTIISVIAVFILANRHVSHFDTSFVTPALIGFYLLSFSVSTFYKWREENKNLLIALFAGPIFAFLYIVLTWIAADTYLIFTGVHRYLTVPALTISFFLGSLIVLAYLRLREINRATKAISFLPLLALIPIVNIAIAQIDEFFKSQLTSGFGASDKIMMQAQLNGFTADLSQEEPSLFYFDFSQDQANGYYYDNTLLGGFKSWMLFHEKINLDKNLQPELVFYPPSGKEILEKSFVREGDSAGFRIGDKFYSIDNFYAFKLKDKRVTDIKEQVLTELGI